MSLIIFSKYKFKYKKYILILIEISDFQLENLEVNLIIALKIIIKLTDNYES